MDNCDVVDDDESDDHHVGFVMMMIMISNFDHIVMISISAISTTFNWYLSLYIILCIVTSQRLRWICGHDI